MSALIAKEAREMVRTYRWAFLPALFLVFGIAGPAVIRLLPFIVERTAQQMSLEIPDMGPADGFAQYLSLSRQVGLLTVIVVHMGIVATERKEGILAMLFVKPVSRLSYLWWRWLVNAAYLLAAFLLGSGVAVAYCALLLGRPDAQAMMAGAGLFLSYMLLVFSWTYLFSSMFRSALAAGGASLVPLFLVPLLGSLWKPFGSWGPYGTVNAATAAVGTAGIPGQPVPVSGVTSAILNVTLSLILVGCSYLLLRRGEL